MEYSLIRAKRKTLCVTVRQDGSVEVRAPRFVTEKQVEEFLLRKREWIFSRQEEMAQAARQREAFSTAPGAELPLLNRYYPVIAGEKAGFTGESFRVVPDKPSKRQLIEIYRGLARRILSKRIALYSTQIGARPAGLRITSAATRFGSCSGRNTLSFPWKLVMAELRFVDYVGVHELCHTLEHNHSKRFWNLVERTMPDYKDREAGLKMFSRELAGQDWTDTDGS